LFAETVATFAFATTVFFVLLFAAIVEPGAAEAAVIFDEEEVALALVRFFVLAFAVEAGLKITLRI
jgi:hypothetical protein